MIRENIYKTTKTVLSKELEEYLTELINENGLFEFTLAFLNAKKHLNELI